jgi:hypothetical protein
MERKKKEQIDTEEHVQVPEPVEKKNESHTVHTIDISGTTVSLVIPITVSDEEIKQWGQWRLSGEGARVALAIVQKELKELATILNGVIDSQKKIIDLLSPQKPEEPVDPGNPRELFTRRCFNCGRTVVGPAQMDHCPYCDMPIR